MMAYFFISFFVFTVVILMMSVGVILSNKTIKGSCGGKDAIGSDGEVLSCDQCPNRELKECEKN